MIKTIAQYTGLFLIAIVFGRFWGTQLNNSEVAFSSLKVIVPFFTLFLFFPPKKTFRKIHVWVIYTVLGILNVCSAFLINYFLERESNILLAILTAAILLCSFVRVWQYSNESKNNLKRF